MIYFKTAVATAFPVTFEWNVHVLGLQNKKKPSKMLGPESRQSRTAPVKINHNCS